MPCWIDKALQWRELVELAGKSGSKKGFRNGSRNCPQGLGLRGGTAGSQRKSSSHSLLSWRSSLLSSEETPFLGAQKGQISPLPFTCRKEGRVGTNRNAGVLGLSGNAKLCLNRASSKRSMPLPPTECHLRHLLRVSAQGLEAFDLQWTWEKRRGEVHWVCHKIDFWGLNFLFSLLPPPHPHPLPLEVLHSGRGPAACMALGQELSSQGPEAIPFTSMDINE